MENKVNEFLIKIIYYFINRFDKLSPCLLLIVLN